MNDDPRGPLGDPAADGQVAIFGGSTTTTSIEEFDPANDTFTRTADMTDGRDGPDVARCWTAACCHGRLYRGVSALTSAEVYTPGGPTNITLVGTDAETAPSIWSFTVTSNPQHGVLSGTAPNLVYTPTANYNGPDSFQFTVTDCGAPDNCGSPSGSCAAALTSAPATVSLVVVPVNDAPVANAQSVETDINSYRPRSR